LFLGSGETAEPLSIVRLGGAFTPFDWIYFRGHQEPRSLSGTAALKKRNGGSPRIHAGELGFQAERLV
jgi:hypothetical protein